MVGGMCDLSHLLIVFDSRMVGLGGGIVGDMISSTDMNGSGDNGHRCGDGVFGCKNSPTISGSSILHCILEVYKTR